VSRNVSSHTTWRQHLATGVALIALTSFVSYFSTNNDAPLAPTVAPEYHKLPYVTEGMRVYVEEVAATRQLLLDTSTSNRVVVATTPVTNEVTTNGQYGRVRFSPTKRYLEYFLGFWEGGTAFVYDTLERKNVFSLPMSDGLFTTDEKFYYTCYYTAFDGSGDAAVYSVPGFKRVANIFIQFPGLTPDQEIWDWNISKCYEDGQRIVFDFGEYSGMGGEDVSGSEVDSTLITVTHRFTFDRNTGEVREVSL
jgi:hypothetical protein